MFRNNYLLIIILGMVGSVLFIIIFCSDYHLKHNFYTDYYEDMGRPTHFLTYTEAIKYYGEPVSTEESQNDSAIFIELKYKDFILYMEKFNEQDDFRETSIEVISDKYEFGPAKIKVGSTIIQVNEAYKNLDTIDDQFLVQTFDDNATAVSFKYNIIGIVTSIRIVPLGVAI